MKLHDHGVYLVNGQLTDTAPAHVTEAEARKGTIAYGILKAHNTAPDMKDLRIKFDSMTSHDITYVGIIQTARASGMEKFPLPYVLTNCHNSLCAVGGTINEDDHQFALSAAHKYGGIYVPPNMAVIHSYNREMMAGCGRMILGSDSHTRYGALGTMAVGEGGGELAKQLVGRTYDMAMPGVICVYLTGRLNPGVGPHDVALALVGATYANGYVKNKVMEFVGPGVASLSADCRNGIDCMTTETTCWSSIWQTDGVTEEYLAGHGRADAYKELKPADVAYYDGCIELDLSKIECMIALPMHPSYAYPIRELKANAKDLLHEIETRANEQLSGKVKMDLVSKVRADGSIYVDQGIVAGCSGGTYENLCAVADILRGKSCGNGEFKFSAYPDSMPTYLELVKNGVVADIVSAGGIFRECFCGPCFGAGDTPANGEFSIRHTTRNFPNREGSKPGEGQISGVALMDARSIAATAANGGILTAASEVCDHDYTAPKYHFDRGVYDKRIYNGWGSPEPETALRFGPNIKDWPQQPELTNDLLVKIVSYITDPVTTTDELIPPVRLLPSAPTRCAWQSSPCPARTRPMSAAPRQSRLWTKPAPQALCRKKYRLCMPRWKRPVTSRTPQPPTLAPPSLPISPAMAPHVSRRLPASACWAARPTLPRSMQPSATAPTASTGACCPSWWRTPACLNWATASTCPACARLCWKLPIPCPPWLLSPMAV